MCVSRSLTRDIGGIMYIHMTSLLKSDIFFFITAIAVIIISVGVAIALVYLVRILRDVKTLSEKAKDEGERIIDDIHMFRQDVKSKGTRLSDILSFVGITTHSRARAERKTKKKDE